MVKYICIDRVKENGKIKGYCLRNILNPKTIVVHPDELKNSIRNKSVEVFNLTLTSDNRLVMLNKTQQELEKYITGNNKSKLFDEMQPVVCERFRNSVDLLIKDSLLEGLYEVRRFVRLKSIDTENNIIVLQFKRNTNVYVMIKYQTKIYGADYKHLVYFDIGFELIGLRYNKQDFSIKCDPLVMSRYLDDANVKEFIFKDNGVTCLYVSTGGKDGLIRKTVHHQWLTNWLYFVLLKYIDERITDLAPNYKGLEVNTDIHQYRNKAKGITGSILDGLSDLVDIVLDSAVMGNNSVIKLTQSNKVLASSRQGRLMSLNNSLFNVSKIDKF